MGEKNRRKARFLAEHPVCCYCGVAASEEPDHMPPRVMFLRREWPEGFEFPSCVPCNRKTRHVEQVVSFYVRTMDNNDATYSEPEMMKLISAVRNNYPELFPKVGLSANDKRRALRARGDALPPGALLHDIDIIEVPAGVIPMIHVFSGKLGKAIYYREKVAPLPKDYALYTRWFDFRHRHAAETVEKLKSILPNLTVGRRTNVDIGDQFSYLWGVSDDLHLFGFVAQLSHAMYIVGAAVLDDIDNFKNIKDEGARWSRAE